jgi:hypothetical protein
MKRNYSYNDHYKFGWGDDTFNFYTKGDQPYWVKYGSVTRPPMSFKDECIDVARLIGYTAKKPILVFASGGIDSEVIQRCFLAAGVPFETVTYNILYQGRIVNDHDTRFVAPFVKEHGIKHSFRDIDLTELLETRYFDSVEKYQTWMPGSIMQAEWAQEYCKDYLCVFGLVDDLLLKRAHWVGITEHKEMVVTQEPSVVSVLHAVDEMDETAVVSFFCYTPEQMLAWFTQEDIRVFVNYQESFPKISMYGLKPFIYFKHWPELAPRQKTHGYEQVDMFSCMKNAKESEFVSRAMNMLDNKKLVTYRRYSDVIKQLRG